MEFQIDGQVVKLDEQDAGLLVQFHWFIVTDKRGNPRLVRQWREGGARSKQHRETLSRIIAKPASGEEVYFLNGDRLDFRRANLEVGRHGHNRLVCPFTAGRLEELYWDRGIGAWEIGRIAAELMGRETPVNVTAVKRWLTDAGIRVRTASEIIRMRVRKDPKTYRLALSKARHVLAGMIQRGEIVPSVAHLHTPEAQRKAHTAARRTFRSRKYRQKCSRAGCDVIVVRSQSKVKPNQPRVYCSMRCADMTRGKTIQATWRRKTRNAAIVPQSPPPTLPDWLTQAMKDAKS